MPGRVPIGGSWDGMLFRADLAFLDARARTFFIRPAATSDFAETLNPLVRAGAFTLVRRVDHETIARLLLPSGVGWILKNEGDDLLRKVWRQLHKGNALLPPPRHPDMPCRPIIKEVVSDPASLAWIINADRIADGEQAIREYEWRRRNPRKAARQD